MVTRDYVKPMRVFIDEESSDVPNLVERMNSTSLLDKTEIVVGDPRQLDKDNPYQILFFNCGKGSQLRERIEGAFNANPSGVYIPSPRGIIDDVGDTLEIARYANVLNCFSGEKGSFLRNLIQSVGDKERYLSLVDKGILMARDSGSIVRPLTVSFLGTGKGLEGVLNLTAYSDWIKQFRIFGHNASKGIRGRGYGDIIEAHSEELRSVRVDNPEQGEGYRYVFFNSFGTFLEASVDSDVVVIADGARTIPQEGGVSLEREVGVESFEQLASFYKAALKKGVLNVRDHLYERGFKGVVMMYSNPVNYLLDRFANGKHALDTEQLMGPTCDGRRQALILRQSLNDTSHPLHTKDNFVGRYIKNNLGNFSIGDIYVDPLGAKHHALSEEGSFYIRMPNGELVNVQEGIDTELNYFSFGVHDSAVKGVRAIGRSSYTEAPEAIVRAMKDIALSTIPPSHATDHFFMRDGKRNTAIHSGVSPYSVGVMREPIFPLGETVPDEILYNTSAMSKRLSRSFRS